MFSVWLYPSLKSLCKDFGSLFFTTLLQFIEVGEHSFLCNTLKVRFFQLEVWTMTGHCSPFILSLFILSVVELRVSLGSLPICLTQYGPNLMHHINGLRFDSRRFLYTEEFMVNLVTARCTCPVAVKQTQIITMLDSCYEIFVVICYGCFLTNIAHCVMCVISTLFFGQMGVFQRWCCVCVCFFFQIQFYKPEPCSL